MNYCLFALFLNFSDCALDLIPTGVGVVVGEIKGFGIFFT